MLGGEASDGVLELSGLDRVGGEEGYVRAGLDFDELSTDLAAGEDVPGLQDLVLKGGIEVELDGIALLQLLWLGHCDSEREKGGFD